MGAIYGSNAPSTSTASVNRPENPPRIDACCTVEYDSTHRPTVRESLTRRSPLSRWPSALSLNQDPVEAFRPISGGFALAQLVRQGFRRASHLISSCIFGLPFVLKRTGTPSEEKAPGPINGDASESQVMEYTHRNAVLFRRKLVYACCV